MSNSETFREKALKSARAADEAHDSSKRAELFGLSSVYMALAGYVDPHHGGQYQHMRNDQLTPFRPAD